MKTIKAHRRLSDAELEALWRPDPDFIGPVAPPMLLWLYRGRPRDAWELETIRRYAERRRDAAERDLPLFAGAAP